MGFKDFIQSVNPFKIEVKEAEVIALYSPDVKEKIKGEVKTNPVQTPSELGEAHPFNYSIMDDLYNNYGLVTAVVDKYVDFIIGPGHHVIFDEEEKLADKAKIIIETWERDINFDSLLRAWVKEAIKKGTSCMELQGDEIEKAKVLNSNYMYIKRSETGEIERYNQFVGDMKQFKSREITPFEPEEIANINFNKCSDAAYGIGIIFPALKTIDLILKNEIEQSNLLSRKANAPIHAKLGSLEHKRMPSPAAVTAFGKKLEWLNNKHEWSTGPDVEMKVLDFGPIGDKFISMLDYLEQQVFYMFQIPSVIMGKGSVPEGLAKVQMRVFQMRIQSFQAEIEKVVETQIYSRILQANGIDAHAEMEWGMPDDSEINDRADRISEIMKLPTLSMTANGLLEKELMQILDMDMDKYKTDLDEEEAKKEEERKKDDMKSDSQTPPSVEREKEENEPQPIVPGEQREHYPHKLNEQCDCDMCEEGSLSKEYSLQEWLGFNYNEYKANIQNIISKDKFVLLMAKTKADIKLGLLNNTQIEALRDTMKMAFNNGESVRWIENRIEANVKPGPRFKVNADGSLRQTVPNHLRPSLIARTETTRLASNGALSTYKEKGVTKVRWLSSIGERTCEQCASMNGEIMTLEEAENQIPLHVCCRCTWEAITDLTGG